MDEKRREKMKKKTDKFLLLVIIFIAIFSVIIISFIEELKINKQSIVKAIPNIEDLRIDSEKWRGSVQENYINSKFLIEIVEPNSPLENKDICFDVWYLPDKEATKYNPSKYDYYYFQEGQTGIFGVKFEDKVSGFESPYLLRTGGDDKIKIIMQDGTEKIRSLQKAQTIYNAIENSHRFERVYDCYFDGELRVTNLTYSELKNELCDNYQRRCQ